MEEGGVIRPGGLLRAEADDIVGYSVAKVEHVPNEMGEAFLGGYMKNMGASCSLVCVLPRWRRRGVGSALLLEAESFIRSKGLGFVVAWAYESDLIAQEFLRKAEYEHHEMFFVEEFSRTLPLNADVEFWKKDLEEPVSSMDMRMQQGYT